MAHQDMKKRLFVDMDGTIAEWHSESGPEELYEEGYFARLHPYTSILQVVSELAHEVQNREIGAEIFIFSAYLADSAYAAAEKREWIARCLPNLFDDAHILLVPCGQSKTAAVPGGVGPEDYLLDDYTKNLREWEAAGGVPIKVFNGCNGKRNPVWKCSVYSNRHPEENLRAIKQALK